MYVRSRMQSMRTKLANVKHQGMSFKDACSPRTNIQDCPSSLDLLREEFIGKLSIMANFMKETVIDSLRAENLRLRELHDQLVSENQSLRAAHEADTRCIAELNAEVLNLNPDHNTWLLELAAYRQR